MAYVHIPTANRGKLDPRALKCVFIGYSSTQKGYRCYHPPLKKYFVSADVTFAENESYFRSSTILEQNQTLINRDSSFLPDPNLL